MHRGRTPTDGRQCVIASPTPAAVCSPRTASRRQAWLARRLDELSPSSARPFEQRRRSSRGSPSREPDLRLARGPQLPPVRRRPARVADRHLDATRRPGLARAAPQPQQRHGDRDHDGPAVPPAPALRAAGRRHRRPFLQAETHLATQVSMGLLLSPSGFWTCSGAVSLYEVYLFAFLLGLATAVDNPTRQAFVSELVGAEELPNAVGLNSATFNAARILGPAAAGLLIEGVGTAWAFLGNAASFIAVIAGLAHDAARRAVPRPPARTPSGQLAGGPAYVRHRRELLVPIVLVGLSRDVRAQLPDHARSRRQGRVPPRRGLLRAPVLSACLRGPRRCPSSALGGRTRRRGS